MRSDRGKLTWILAIGLLLEVLSSTNAHAELFRRRIFGRSFRPLQFGVSNRGFVNNNQRFFNNSSFNRNANFQDVKEVLGFSQLLQAGNNIIEKTSEGLIRRLQIRGNGELVAFDPRFGNFVRPEAETIRHLRQFYLKNLDKFDGNNRNIVTRFLQANGGISDGRFVVDLDAFDLGGNFSKLPLEERRKAALASLNFLLNTLQTRFKLRIPPEKVINGKVELNLGAFFRPDALAIMAQADPSFQCTGRMRLNSLISFTTDPANYYRILGAPDNSKDLANGLGIELDKTKTIGNKLAVLGHESGVSSGEQRIIEVQNTQNVAVNGQALSSCYRSLDVQDRPQGGIEAESRNLRLKGINFQHEAEEWLCLGQNGFMQMYLFNNPDGKRLDEAPASIAHQSGALGPAIRAGISCLDCHSGGFIAGGQKQADPKNNYTDFSKRQDTFPTSPTVFRDSLGRFLNHKDFFTDNASYVKRAQLDSNIFINAQRETGSYYLFPPQAAAAPLDLKNPEPLNGMQSGVKLIPRTREAYDKGITPETAARELGISLEAARKLVVVSGTNAPNDKLEERDKMTRTEFDKKFCNLQQGINADLNEFQTRDLLERESRQPFRGIGTDGFLHNGGASFNPNGFNNGSQFNRSFRGF